MIRDTTKRHTTDQPVAAQGDYVLHSEKRTGGFAVQAVLEATGARYRLVEVPEHTPRPAALVALNPLGQVPVVELPDGTAMSESSAIILHLVDTLAPGRLAPAVDSPERAVFLRWFMFMAVNIYPAMHRHHYASRYTADDAGAAGVKQAARAHLDSHFALIDQIIGNNRFMLSDSFSAADPYLLMFVHWYPETQQLLARHSNIARVCDATRGVPAVAAANVFHRLW